MCKKNSCNLHFLREIHCNSLVSTILLSCWFTENSKSSLTSYFYTGDNKCSLYLQAEIKAVILQNHRKNVNTILATVLRLNIIEFSNIKMNNRENIKKHYIAK